jgi:hypothetical protein
MKDIAKADKLIVEAMGFRFESSVPDAISYVRLNPREAICERRDGFFMTVLQWAKGRHWWPDFIAKTGWHDSQDVSYAAIPVESIDSQILSRRLYEYLVAEMSE